MSAPDNLSMKELAMRSMLPVMLLCPLLGGCFGVYGEVSATTLPSATISSGGSSSTQTTTSATSVGFDVGVEFGNVRQRFAMTYSHDGISSNGMDVGQNRGGGRYDHDIFSIGHHAHVRLGAGFGYGTASVAGGDEGGGAAYALGDFTYFLNWHVALHAAVGGEYLSQALPTGDLTGTGATFRLGLSLYLGDTRPNPSLIEVLDQPIDITGALKQGAQRDGCSSTIDTKRFDGNPFLVNKCPGGDISYLQVDRGLGVWCRSMFEDDCRALDDRITQTALNALFPWWKDEAPVPASAPAPAPAAAPAPATAPSSTDAPAAPPPGPAPDAPAPTPPTPTPTTPTP